jgi:signal transduction histidine kinase/ligand-binding sensor domain-containing protein
LPSVEAVIVAVPTATALTVPAEETVATELALLVQPIVFPVIASPAAVFGVAESRNVSPTDNVCVDGDTATVATDAEPPEPPLSLEHPAATPIASGTPRAIANRNRRVLIIEYPGCLQKWRDAHDLLHRITPDPFKVCPASVRRMTRSRSDSSLPECVMTVIFAAPIMRVAEPFLGFILLTGAGTASVSAQGAAPHVDHFTVDDGLAQNWVQAVAQDRSGFIWLGGDRGLQRFDGYSFTLYSALDPAASRELSGLIDGIRVDATGALWVQASGALFRRDPAMQHFIRVALEHGPIPPSAGWAPDSAGRMWVIDGGALRWIEPGTAGARLHTAPGQTSWPGTIVLATSRSGGVWLARTEAGRGRVARFDPVSGKVNAYPLETVTLPMVMLEDAQGQVWVGGEGGVELLPAGGDRFQSVPAFRGLIIRALIPQDSTVVLVPTDGALFRVNPRGSVIERWDLPAAGALPTDVVVDHEGGIWVTTLADGVVRIDPRTPLFRYASSRSTPPLALGSDFVTSLAQPGDGALWVGTLRGGAYRVSADGKPVAFRHRSGDTRSLASDEVLDFISDRAGGFWVATNRGLCRFEQPGFRCYALDQGAIGIVRDNEGWFWFANGPASVVSFDPVTGKFGPEVGTPTQILWLHIDPDSGELWMGGAALLRVRVAAGRIIGPLQPIDATVSPLDLTYAMHRDRHGDLWLGGHQGLQRWDSASRRFAVLDVPELRRVTVFSIEEDSEASLWLGTSQGLVHYSPPTGRARRYRRQDGVLSGEFNRRAAVRLRDGELIFGGVDGLTRVRPEPAAGSPTAAPIVFTRWRKVTKNGQVDAPVDTMSRLLLGPGDRAFSIDFAALTFAVGPARRYRYRLEGQSDEWMESTDHVVTYSTPPPGRYTFRVQEAADREGEWLAPGGSVGLQVIPPFWSTTWFRGLLLLGFVVIAWTAHRARLRQVLATERIRLRISRDLHDEIGAGLSSIALLSDSVGVGGALAEPERARIGQSAREMVDDLRDIVWAIDPEADHLDDVVTRMKDVAATLLHSVRLTFNTPAARELSERIGMTARRDLLLVYKEVLHNVAKHARASEVTVDIVARGTVLELTVSDNGVGFNPGEPRTGTGSKSMHERVARLGGTLGVTSAPGQGTTTRLTLRRT